MKTTTTILSLLLAAGSTALAQESSNQVHQVRRIVIGSGGPGMSATGVAGGTATVDIAVSPTSGGNAAGSGAGPENFAAGAQIAEPAETPNVRRTSGSFSVTGSGGTGGGAPVTSGGYSVPTVRVDQIVDPVGWSFVDGSEGIENAIRAHFQSGPVTYLGVTTSPPAGEVAAQLAIPFGTGLVVNVIGDGSPAEKAGIQQHDVLTKLDDQILIDAGQLAVLVVNHKEGDTVKLTLIRKGQTQEIPVVLGKRESSGDPAATHSLPGNIDLLLDGKLQQPLRTYTRRLDLSNQALDQSKTQLDMSKAQLDKVKEVLKREMGTLAEQRDIEAKKDADVAAATAAGQSVQAQLEEVRKMIEDLAKKVEEKK
jgi:hypothetical protein